MTTLTPPAIPRGPEPSYSVWDVVAANITLSGMTRPLPRPCEPLPWCLDYDALAVWDAILPAPAPVAVAVAHASAVAVSRSGPSVSFGGVSIGGSSSVTVEGDTITVIETSNPAPEPVAPVPLPAALPMMVAALFLLWRMTR